MSLGSLPRTVQCPAFKGMQSTEGQDVSHSPAEARTVWKGLQDAGSQAEHRGQVQNPVAVHVSFSQVNEAFGHIPKSAWLLMSSARCSPLGLGSAGSIEKLQGGLGAQGGGHPHQERAGRPAPSWTSSCRNALSLRAFRTSTELGDSSGTKNRATTCGRPGSARTPRAPSSPPEPCRPPCWLAQEPETPVKFKCIYSRKAIWV